MIISQYTTVLRSCSLKQSRYDVLSFKNFVFLLELCVLHGPYLQRVVDITFVTKVFSSVL